MARDNQNHLRVFRPLRGGIAIQNPVVGHIGTLGMIAAAADGGLWLVSCFHVLCRMTGPFPASTSEPILQPYRLIDQTPVAMVDGTRADQTLDGAAAHVSDGHAVQEVFGVGRLSAARLPEIGMRVIKSGAETGITEGRILRITGDEMEIGCPGFPGDYELSGPGDSGSVWIDADTLSPVGLHFAGNDDGQPECAFAKRIIAVLSRLGLT